ncbi:hypothetical protein RI528_00265 [Aeromonas veronii]|uniref:hypothetical protein n=1 Tax=Aeromonas veronii TaxID=654 RepID=UPI0034220A38
MMTPSDLFPRCGSGGQLGARVEIWVPSGLFRHRYGGSNLGERVMMTPSDLFPRCGSGGQLGARVEIWVPSGLFRHRYGGSNLGERGRMTPGDLVPRCGSGGQLGGAGRDLGSERFVPAPLWRGATWANG